MDTSPDRDQSIERLLRESRFRTPAEPPQLCLDPETMAAWVDGGLRGAALEAAEVHVADCQRCQSALATMSRAAAAAPAIATTEDRSVRRWLGWVVPLTAAATALVLWVGVREQRAGTGDPGSGIRSDAGSATTLSDRANEKGDQAPLAPVAASPPPAQQQQSSNRAAGASSPSQEARQDATVRQEAELLKREAPEEPVSATPAAPPAPQTPTARAAVAAPTQNQAAAAEGAADSAPPASVAETVTVERSAPTLGEAIGRRATLATVGGRIEIASPDGRVRWRIAGRTVERSIDGGTSWEAATLPNGVSELTAGAAPSSATCWVVGRGGVVLVTIDGRTWRRLPFPEVTDLTSVRATDARSASISAADGRVFSTSDAGGSWDRR